MPITIRPFSTTDTDAVISLWKQCNLVSPKNDPVEDIRLKMEWQPEFFLIAENENSTIVGSIMAGYEGHRGWINYLGVVPEYRKKGIATKLMEAAEKKLKTHGCPKINLQVRTSNSDVLVFYEKIGFKSDNVVGYGKRL